MLECKIHNITLSDHSPVSLVRDLGRFINSRRCRLNVSLLNDNTFRGYIRTELAQHLEFIDTNEISPVTLWEAAKVVMRGKIISFASAKKILKETKRIELEKQIKQLEQKHKKTVIYK